MEAWYITSNTDKIKAYVPDLLQMSYSILVQHIPKLRRVVDTDTSIEEALKFVLKYDAVLKMVDRNKSGHMGAEYEVVIYNSTLNTKYIWFELSKTKFYEFIDKHKIKLT